MGGMSETEKLIREIDAFLRQHQMADSTFGRKAVNDGKLLTRLRSDQRKASVTLETAARIRAFMSSFDGRRAA